MRAAPFRAAAEGSSLVFLKRYQGNPILEPTSNWWECKAVFNCAAALKDGRVHLLYRAVGEDNLSRLGLAVSDDGFNFQRFDLPVFEGDAHIEWERLGVEDPRVTEIDGRYYVTYVAASVYPMGHPRPAWSFGAPWRTRVCLAVTDDFRSFQRLGVILPDSDNKDVALFPGKAGGRWVLFHREFPHMWVAWSDDLLHWKDDTVLMEPRQGMWDCNRLGASAPPFRTDLGWVELYHGVDDHRRYALGFSVHALDDPSRVLGRSPEPVLAPQEPYERDGLVPNVCFSCGLVEKDGVFFIYYGAADTRIGVATVGRDELMDYLRGICGGCCSRL